MSKRIQKKARPNQITSDDLLEKNLITQDKKEILDFKIKHKILIGGKGSGKTIISMYRMLMSMNNYGDKKMSAIGLRKYKEQAVSSMSRFFRLAYDNLTEAGIKLFRYKKSTSTIQNYRSSRSLENGHFQMSSLENSESFNGYSDKCQICVIDEPVIQGDQSMKMEDWELLVGVLEDNIFRHLTQAEKNDATIFYNLNPWDRQAPVMIRAEAIFPEETFERKLFLGETINDWLGNKEKIEANIDKLEESFEENACLWAVDGSTDTLVARMTKYANPTLDRKNLIKSVKNVLLSGNRNLLLIILGLSYEAEGNNFMNVFGIKREEFKKYNLNDYINNKTWEITRILWGVDIDTSRVITISPTYLFRQRTFDGYRYKIHIDNIIEIKTHGTGSHGELNKMYVAQIKDAMNSRLLFNHNNYLENIDQLVFIDDKRQWFVYEFLQIKPHYINGASMFTQHGAAGLIERQNVLETGIKKGVISFGNANDELINDILDCKRQIPSNPKRDTRGRTNYLDRIDAAEQTIWHLRPFVIEPTRAVSKSRKSNNRWFT